MTELDQDVKKNDSKKINNLTEGSPKSLICKAMYESVILRFLLRQEPVGNSRHQPAVFKWIYISH
jgi:hypothetical protein